VINEFLRIKDMIPVLGMTMDYSPETDKRPFSKGDDLYYENTAYVRYLEKVECVPILLPTLHDLNRVAGMVAAVDGILLTGGDDVSPEFYGEKTINSNWRIDVARTYFESRLIKEALAQQKPIYGICRGCQMLNVALGGNMYQDITTQVKNAIEHTSPNKPNWRTHVVLISSDSLLHSILNKRKITVTSSHHQAIKDLVADLRIGATAEDNIIEAVDKPDEKFVLGVQWHPEVMANDPVQLQILQAFINACRRE
jgi:putative glutamine amidotransferase